MPVRTTLRAGYAEVAIRIQEAMDDLTSGDVRGRLQDGVRDATKDTGNWAYYIDHTGDEESGDVYYSCGGDTMCSPYEMAKSGDTAAKATVHHDQGMKVTPRVIYEPEAEDADHYAAMSEAFKTAKLYTGLPVYERFISKTERDSADDSDFAGKGKSFPILKAGDVSAAFHALGRAGTDNYGVSKIRANIIAIAKRKGFPLPKSAQDTKKESAKPGNTTGLKLVESAGCAFLGKVPVREAARSAYPIKIISPGTGSSAHYTEACLKDAAKSGAFKKGTFMFWNHPTGAQESQRPEGDLNDLAAITTSDGEYRETGAKGPGIYADAKVMADYADKIEARAPHIGLSIRAGGTTSGKTIDGKPVLASIDHVESVDYVTRAGRGGMALAESAQFTKLLESFNEGEVSDMDAAEIKKLQESLAAQTAINERLLKRALRADALELAGAVLATTSLTEAQRKFVAESVVNTGDVPTKDGVLDAARLTESVNAFAKAYSATLPATGGVRGLGAGPTLVTESAEVKAAREAHVKTSQALEVKALMELGLSEAAAKESVGVAA